MEVAQASFIVIRTAMTQDPWEQTYVLLASESIHIIDSIMRGVQYR